MVNNQPSSRNRLGSQVWLRFSLGQHSRDENLLKHLIEFFGVGRYVPGSTKKFGEFIVTDIKGLTDKIIPFFDKYKIIGALLELWIFLTFALRGSRTSKK